jgi:hypothetical protein
MGIFETFSKRMRRKERAGKAEAYQYDTLPRALRIQVIHIWTTAVGVYAAARPNGLAGGHPEPRSNEYWKEIHDTMARELGVFHLGAEKLDVLARCQEFLLKADTGGALDIIEISFRWIDKNVRKLRQHEKQFAGIRQEPDEAIEELNHRFREHGVGYQFVEGELVRLDSQYVHAEVMKPAMALLQRASFQGASDEFMGAHEHYRKGRHKEAIAEGLKAFESVLLTVCQLRGWSYGASATAGRLIETVFANGLIPADLKGHFTALPSLVQSGLPSLRNKHGGHGQGATTVAVPAYLAAYALHLAAANIVLVVEAHLGRG